MDRFDLKGMIGGGLVGSLIALTSWIETESIFPIPASKSAGFLTYVVLMGTCIGWTLVEFRSR